MESCTALAGISLEFAEHGAGLMPADVVAKLEAHYLDYRSSYNSFLGMTSNRFVGSLVFSHLGILVKHVIM